MLVVEDRFAGRRLGSVRTAWTAVVFALLEESIEAIEQGVFVGVGRVLINCYRLYSPTDVRFAQERRKSGRAGKSESGQDPTSDRHQTPAGGSIRPLAECGRPPPYGRANCVSLC
jgi:hypothetical protein